MRFVSDYEIEKQESSHNWKRYFRKISFVTYFPAWYFSYLSQKALAPSIKEWIRNPIGVQMMKSRENGTNHQDCRKVSVWSLMTKWFWLGFWGILCFKPVISFYNNKNIILREVRASQLERSASVLRSMKA